VEGCDVTPSPREIREATEPLLGKLLAVKLELIQMEPGAETEQLRMLVRLNPKLENVTSVVSCFYAPPPKQACDVFAHLFSRIDEQLARVQSLIEEEVAAFGALISDANLPEVRRSLGTIHSWTSGQYLQYETTPQSH